MLNDASENILVYQITLKLVVSLFIQHLSHHEGFKGQKAKLLAKRIITSPGSMNFIVLHDQFPLIYIRKCSDMWSKEKLQYFF